MIKFFYLSQGEKTEVDFTTGQDTNCPLQEYYNSQPLDDDDDFNQISSYGIYRFENLVSSSLVRTDRPANLAGNGYLFVLSEKDYKMNRAVFQLCFSEENSVAYCRRGFLNRGALEFDNWENCSINTSSIALSTITPSQTVGGIWNQEEQLDSTSLSLWAEKPTIITLSDTNSDLNVLLDVSTLALSGAQSVYIRDSASSFSKMVLDISCGGTGANTASGALTSLGAASATDLAALQDSVSYTITDYKSGFASYADDQKPKLIYNSNICCLTGGLKNTKELTTSAYGSIPAFNIPEKFAPFQQFTYVAQGSLMNKLAWTLSVDGTVLVSRYGVSTNITIPASAWLNLGSIMWFYAIP